MSSEYTGFKTKTIATDAITVTGDSAVVIGSYQQTVEQLSNQQDLQVHGTLKAEWMRQPDGRWLIQRMSTL